MKPVAAAVEFVGTIETVDPVAISTPARRAEGGKPVPAQTERRYFDGQLQETLIIPATSIRGRLRHTATRLVMQSQIETGDASFKVADYLLTALGGVVDAAAVRRAAEPSDDADGQDAIIKDGAVDLDRQQALRQRNPIVSLFGSMDSSVMSKLHVRSAIPVEPLPPGSAVIGAGSRANPLNRDPEIFSSGVGFFQPADVQAFITANRTKVDANKLETESERLVKDARGKRKAGDKAGADNLEADAKALADQAKAMSASVGGKVNLQQPLGGWQAIPAGAQLRHSMRLERPTATELALFLATLFSFAEYPIIGGHIAAGCGRIKADWSVRIAGEIVGRVVIDGEGSCAITSEHPVLQEAAEKAAKHVEELAAAIDVRV